MTHPIHPDPVVLDSFPRHEPEVLFANWCASVDALSQDWEAWKARHPEVFGKRESGRALRG